MRLSILAAVVLLLALVAPSGASARVYFERDHALQPQVEAVAAAPVGAVPAPVVAALSADDAEFEQESGATRRTIDIPARRAPCSYRARELASNTPTCLICADSASEINTREPTPAKAVV